MENAQELGRVKKDDQTDVIIRRGEYKGRSYVDIREYLTTDSYQGFTRKGVMMPADIYPELVQQLNKG